MKKIFSILTMAILAFCFTACEDVPAPYGIGEEISSTEKVLMKADLTSQLDPFVNFTTEGEGEWVIDHSTAKASGYDFESKVNTPGVYYLVSPEFSLEGQTDAYLTFEYIQAYASRIPDGNKLFITDQFDPAKADQNWKEMPVTFKEPYTFESDGRNKIDWKKFHTMNVQLPAEYMGKRVRIAFYHKCTDQASTTLELKHVKVLAGKTEGGEEVKPENPEGESIFAETFANGFGAFTVEDKAKDDVLAGKDVWRADSKYGCIKTSVFFDEANHAAESWVVSPVIDMTKATVATLSYEEAGNKFNSKDAFFAQCLVKVRVEGGQWENIERNSAVEGASWSFVPATADLKAYVGKKIQIAFAYTSTAEAGGVWEIKNLNILGDGGSVNPNPEKPEGNDLFTETLDGTFGQFTVEDKAKDEALSGKDVWKADPQYHCVKTSVWDGSANHAAESWLVSPVIDMTQTTKAFLNYEEAGNKFNSQKAFFEQCLVKVRVEGGQWENVSRNSSVDGASWSFVPASADLNAYVGKKIQIAFAYTSTAEAGGVWEVKNVKINGEGTVGPQPEPQPGVDNTGDVNALNGDFECWVDGQPNNWKPTCSAGGARLHQSTDAHSGKYSVRIEGYTSNKRMAYKELDLKAGTYTWKVYVKAATAEGGSARLGYAEVPADGSSLSGNSYVYSENYSNNLTTDTWVEASETFTIANDGKYCFLIQNPKKPGKDILVDDATLTKDDGTVIIK